MVFLSHLLTIPMLRTRILAHSISAFNVSEDHIASIFRVVDGKYGLRYRAGRITGANSGPREGHRYH
jgi:hypothetical protein